jgi:hypothetical protein
VAYATPTCSGGGRTPLQWSPRGIPGVVRPPLALHSGGRPTTLGFTFTLLLLLLFYFYFYFLFFLYKKDLKENKK